MPCPVAAIYLLQSVASVDLTKIGESVLFHGMLICRICITTLAPSHPVLAEKKKVTEVDYNVGGANRLENKASGKSKRVSTFHTLDLPFHTYCSYHYSWFGG